MTDKLVRGQMYEGNCQAVRVMAHVAEPFTNWKGEVERQGKVEWSIIMPRRDSRFGVLGSGRHYNSPEEREAIEAADLPMTDVKDGATKWIKYGYGWAHGIFIGYVAKYEAPGMMRSGWDGDEGGMDFGAKKVTLATIALRGTRDGFVLLYAFPDDLELP